MKKPVHSFVRAYNREAILRTIRVAELISRIDIARATGLSQASVTGITADLIREGLIQEKKSGIHERGRPPVLLSISPDGAYAIGINLTNEKIDVAIINFQAEIKAFHSHKLNSLYYTVEDIVDRMVRCVQECMWEANFSKDMISGIGIGIPGLVDSESGKIRFLPNYGWENVNLRDLFQNQINLPTYIENSSNNLAIAEQWFGEGKGIDNFLVVTIENGVGLGAVINGRIYQGQEGIAGEFGHITINPDGPECRCGKKGCVEAYAGKIVIMRDARQAVLDGLWDCENPGHFTYEDVVRAAQNGADVLRRLFDRAGLMLGIGISHLITLFNPTKIIITGQGVRAGDLIFDAMYSTFDNYLSAKFGRQTTQIIVQQWTEQDWARGAGALVLQELYKSPVGQVATDR